MPSRRAPRSARRASRRPTIRTPFAPRVRSKYACRAGSPMVSIGATAWPTRATRDRDGSSRSPKWRPTKITGLPVLKASATVSRRLHENPLVDIPGVQRWRARHFEVIAGVVAEGRADEALERHGVAGGSTTSGDRGRARRGPARRDADCAGLGGRSGAARYHAVPAHSASRMSGPSGSQPGNPRERTDQSRADARTIVPRRRFDPVAGHRRWGPGSGRPACMTRARRSRSAASPADAGHIGELYHCSGAAPTIEVSSSAIACVARCSSAGSSTPPRSARSTTGGTCRRFGA